MSNLNSARGSQRNVGGATVAATAITRVMIAEAKKRNYVSGFDITGGGATGASNIEATLTGVQGGTQTFVICVPAGVNTQVSVSHRFDPELEAVDENTAITLTVPSFGAGNTQANANLRGFTTARG